MPARIRPRWFPHFARVIVPFIAPFAVSASTSSRVVPMEGNAFLTKSGNGPEDGLGAGGLTQWKFSEPVERYQAFKRPETPDRKPQIDFRKLEGLETKQ